MRKPVQVVRRSVFRRSDPESILYIKALKATAPRVAIYSLFQKTLEPLCIDQIAEKIPQLSLASIYRTLEKFVEVKLIEKTTSQEKFGVTRKKKRVFYQIF